MRLHLAADLAVILAAIGLPYLTTDHFRQLGQGTDAVTSASVILAQPSGEFLVLLNTAKHPDAKNLALWEQLFTGDEAPVIFEDICCLTAKNDSAGQEAAASFQSRLPENQMQVRAIDATLLLSKADVGCFDLIILSQEAADAYGAESAFARGDIRVLHIGGAGA